MLLALTRPVPPTLARCELTHLEREAIDVTRARAQHAEYQAALESLGCTVQRLPMAPEHPDSVFVEDAAVVVDERAVIARPGAASRRAETTAVADALRAHRDLATISAPATLDGGDVLLVGRRAYVGRSSRTNADGVRQLAAALSPHGYTVESVAIRDCLHLKSAVSSLGDGGLLLDPRSVDAGAFGGAPTIEVDPVERFAANVLCVNGTVLCPTAAPRTIARLERAGYVVRAVEASELAKAEGGLTCCSIIFAA